MAPESQTGRDQSEPNNSAGCPSTHVRDGGGLGDLFLAGKDCAAGAWSVVDVDRGNLLPGAGLDCCVA